MQNPDSPGKSSLHQPLAPAWLIALHLVVCPARRLAGNSAQSVAGPGKAQPTEQPGTGPGKAVLVRSRHTPVLSQPKQPGTGPGPNPVSPSSHPSAGPGKAHRCQARQS
jgi:hypothetical protein